MKHNPRQVAALRAIGVSLHDAHALGRITVNLTSCNRSAWPDDADCWRVAIGDDGEPFFELSDKLGREYVRRHISEWEKAQLGQLREIMGRYPRLHACMRPSPEDQALEIICGEPELDELEGGYIAIRPTAKIPQLPADDDNILG